MTIQQLLKAIKTYQSIIRDTGDLSDINIDDLRKGLMDWKPRPDPCSREKKEKFDQAQNDLESELNSYIKAQVELILESKEIST